MHAPLYVAIITMYRTACPLPTPHPSLLPRSPSLPLCLSMDGLSAVHHPVAGTRQSRLVPKDFTPFCLPAMAGTWGVNDDVRDTPARKFQEWLPSDGRREKVLYETKLSKTGRWERGLIRNPVMANFTDIQIVCLRPRVLNYGSTSIVKFSVCTANVNKIGCRYI